MNPLDPVVVIPALVAAITGMAAFIAKLQADALKAARDECKEWKEAAQVNGRTADEALRISRSMSETLDKIADRDKRGER